MINEIKQNFMVKRLRAQEECNEFLSNLRENEEFNNLYTTYTQKQLDYIKSRYDEENISLKHEVEDLKQKIDAYLSNKNISPSSLEPHYDCSICNDTGVVGGQICKCLLKELNTKISRLTSSQSKFKSFSQCNTDIMTSSDIRAKELLQEWCKKFPRITKININILGNAGCGKTFFLECIANEIIEKNYNVCYKTAFDLNELCRLYHIGQSNELYDMIKADVLLIDDLGTEPILKNVTKEYIYNIINQRQVNNKPTIITTNLSPQDILDRYDERIFSRLANKMLSINIQLDSKDKRIS